MDKKYNESWVVVIGQGFAFEVTHEVKHVLWMFMSDLSTLVYKGAALRRVTHPYPRRTHRLCTQHHPTASPPRRHRTLHHGSWREASRCVSAIAVWARYLVGSAAIVHI